MKKIMLSFILPILCVFVLFALVFLLVESDRIQHYNQYLVPMEGRVCVYPASEAVLPFYFLDEKELSELAQNSNIQEVFLVRKDGTKLAAKDWNVTSSESLYAGSKFAAKQLTVTIMPEETTDFCDLILKYPDKQEQFNIGNLQVYVIPANPYEPYFQCLLTFSGEGDQPALSQYDKFLDFKESLSFGVFNINPARQTRILAIDLGILDVALDSESLKQIPPDFDFGINMTQDSAYGQYLRIHQTATLEPATINLEVRSSVTYLAGLKTTRKSLEEIGILLICPKFRCLDLTSGEEFYYANTNYITVGVKFLDDRLAGELLEQEGI